MEHQEEEYDPEVDQEVDLDRELTLKKEKTQTPQAQLYHMLTRQSSVAKFGKDTRYNAMRPDQFAFQQTAGPYGGAGQSNSRLPKLYQSQAGPAGIVPGGGPTSATPVAILRRPPRAGQKKMLRTPKRRPGDNTR